LIIDENVELAGRSEVIKVELEIKTAVIGTLRGGYLERSDPARRTGDIEIEGKAAIGIIAVANLPLVIMLGWDREFHQLRTVCRPRPGFAGFVGDGYCSAQIAALGEEFGVVIAV